MYTEIWWRNLKECDQLEARRNGRTILTLTLTFISLLFRFYMLDMTPWSHVMEE
jgi:hypothetical protein